MWRIEDYLPAKLAVIHLEDVQVSADKRAFAKLLQCAAGYKSRYAGKSIGEIERTQYARSLFRAIGIDPTKQRPASEALLNRALKEKEFYSLNSLVDVGNWCSLDFLLPICVYDADKIVGHVSIRKGKQGESFLGLNNRVINLHRRYVITDQQGAFGSPITDSQRTAVSLSTVNALLDIFAPKEYESKLLLKRAQAFAARASEICGGRLINIQIAG